MGFGWSGSLGKKYNEVRIELFGDKGNLVTAQFYLAEASAINNEELGFDWY